MINMINVLKTCGWEDYELIDSGYGQRLERFGKYILSRPDPQAIWRQNLNKDIWDSADAVYVKTGSDKGRWEIKNNIPEKWIMEHNGLKFYCKLTPFKHTGVFPEQSIHWDFIRERIKSFGKQSNILNLFGYTGIASLAAVSEGAKVTHVDSSYQAIGWAKENQQASKLENKPIRWILDDVIKFCEREVRRNAKYDGIIMDPPVYGHGPKGEKWDFYESFPTLLKICKNLLSNNPLFVIVNAYAVSASAIMLENTIKDYLNITGEIETGELAIQEKNSERLLSTGIFSRYPKS